MPKTVADVLAEMKTDCEGAVLDAFTTAQKHKYISIYRVQKRAGPSSIEHCGSGMLFHHAERHFVVSAAHVFNNTARYELGAYRRISGRLDSVVFEGQKWTTSGADSDQVDVGVFPLDDEDVQFFGAENFYTVNDCSPEHVCNVASLYTAMGFPNKHNEPNRYQNRLRVQPISYSRNGASAHRFAKLGLSQDTHQLLDLRRTVYLAKGGTQSPPAIRGMSGGPVFHFHHYAQSDANTMPRVPKLVGLLIEKAAFDREHVLVSSHIQFALKAMEVAASELRA